MRRAKTPEGRRLRELLHEGPVRRAEAISELERCVSHHRALARTVTAITGRGTLRPYRSVEEMAASGQREKARQAIYTAIRSGVAKETIDEAGEKWLSWA